MKFALVLLFVAFVYADEEWRIQTSEDLQEYRNTCVSTLGITPEQVAQYKKWNFADDAPTRSYILCIFKAMRLFDETNGFNIEHLVQQLGQGQTDKDALKTKIETCAGNNKNESGDEPAVRVYRGLKCFRAENLQLIQASLKPTPAA